MAENDRPPNPTEGALSLDEAERLASQFTPLWEDPSAASAPPPAPPPAAPPPPAPAVAASPAVQVVAAPKPIAAPAGVFDPVAPPAPPPAPPPDPDEVALPDSKALYAPPQPLQKTMIGMSAPAVSVDVATPASATTTPVAVPSPSSNRGGQQWRAEAAPVEDYTREDASKIDTIPPKSRHIGNTTSRKIVLVVMGGAVTLVAIAALRAALATKDDGAISSGPRGAVVTAAPAAKVDKPPEPPKAEPEPPKVEPEPPKEAPAEPTTEADKADPTSEQADTPRAPTKAARAATARPRPKTGSAAKPRPTESKPPPRPASSPRPTGGGTIVRESPF